MENNPIIDLGKSLRDMLVVIGFPTVLTFQVGTK